APARRARIHAEELSLAAGEVLGVPARIAAAAPVADADVQPSVWAEGDLPAVVVRVPRVLDVEQHFSGALPSVGERGGGTEARDADVAAVVGVVDVEVAGLPVVRRKGDRVEPALTAKTDEAPDVEKEPAMAAADLPDLPFLLDDVDRVVAGRRRR